MQLSKWTLAFITKFTAAFSASTIVINTIFNIPDENYYNNLANFIEYINTMQIISQKSIIITNLENISDSVDWTNPQYESANNTVAPVRSLLKIAQDNSGYRKFNTITKYIYILVIPFFIAHFLTFYISNKYKIDKISKYLKGIFGFPSFQLVVIFGILSPFIQALSILYACYLHTHDVKAKNDALISMSVLPFPIIILAFYYVLKNIWPYKFEKNRLYYDKNIFPDVYTALTTNSLGKWHPKELEGSFGIFYEHLRGPCNTTYINFFRLFHVPIKLIKNSAICYIINCYDQGIYGNRRQLILLIFLESFNIFNMINCRPLNGIRQQMCEVLSEVCSLFVYIFSLRLLDFRVSNNNPDLYNKMYIDNINSSQKAGLGVFIISQIWSGMLSLRLLIMYIYSKVNKDPDANHTSSNVRTEIAEGNYDEAAGDTGGLNINTE
jgi:hypothetical protein